MSVQYTGGCVVHQGMFSTLGVFSALGGYHEHTGGWSVQWGIPWVLRGGTMMSVGDITSTPGGYYDECDDQCGGISWVHWGMFSTLGFPHKFSCFPKDLPHIYHDIHIRNPYEKSIKRQKTTKTPGVPWYPPGVLNTPQCTHDIPPVYSWYSLGVLNISHCSHTPQCTAQTSCKVEIPVNIFTHLSVDIFYSPKGSSSTFKTWKI